MARFLMDCRPLCGHPWVLELATTPSEQARAFRLRFEVFFQEEGYGPVGATEDIDSFDAWCDHITLRDVERDELVAACRAIPGSKAIDRGGFYGAHEFDYTPLTRIFPVIIQGSRTCVAKPYRTGPAIQYLSYGMELLLREYGAKYFLGTESFTPKDLHDLSVIHAYLMKYGKDPEFTVQATPASYVAGLVDVEVTPEDVRRLSPVIRMDLHMGFRSCGPPAWDPEFRSYDVLMLGRRDRLTKVYENYIQRIERVVVAPLTKATLPTH